jgi:hypothetical protein
MNKRLVALLAVPLLVLSVLVASNASARTPKKFDWHVSDAFIQQGTGLTQTGARAQAANGDFIRVSGSGTFNASTGKATGGGVFAHTDTNGVLVGFGTFEATGVKSFESFGCGGEGFPPNFCGGVLELDVHGRGIDLTAGPVEADAVLTIHCAIGPDVPAGTHEGITLDVTGLINFDTLVEEESGLTLFVAGGDTVDDDDDDGDED